jgi:hypothetical protein
MNLQAASTDGVALSWSAPPDPRGIVIHVPAFGQTKEQASEVLDEFVARGFAAIAIDAYQHGARGTEDREAITQRVFANFRREMWTIIGETALDLPRVVEWSRQVFGATLQLHLTGLSMGGDVVVAAAPLIEEVATINAVIATPDWRRPGMRDLTTDALIEQGNPDPKARLLFCSLNPVDHFERYRGLKTHFIVGDADTHVPPVAADRFAASVNAGTREKWVSVTRRPSLKHLDFLSYPWVGDLDFTASEKGGLT